MIKILKLLSTLALFFICASLPKPAYGLHKLRKATGLYLTVPMYEHLLVPAQRSLEHIYPPGSPQLKTAQRQDRIKVGIVDTGIDYNHYNLAYKITQTPPLPYFYMFYSEPILRLHPFDYLPYTPWEQHGTSVASIAASDSEDIELVPMRENTESSQAWTNMHTLILFAYQDGVSIFNLSLGMGSESMSDANFINLRKQWLKTFESCPNALFIIAAGNSDLNLDLEKNFDFPASFSREISNVITVGAVEENTDPNSSSGFKKASYSNYGATVVQLATYGKFVALRRDQDAKTVTGTSFSAPKLTNVVVRMKASNPDLSPSDTVRILRDSAIRDPQLVDYFGWGILNEERALKMALPEKTSDLLYDSAT